MKKELKYNNILPIPEESGIFYQKVTIDITADVNEYRVRLDDNFKYCVGVMLINPSGTHVTKRIFGIRKNGVKILDDIPFGLIDSGSLFDLKEKFFKLNMKASGEQISLYIDNAGEGIVPFEFLFLLQNKKIDYKIPRFDYNLFDIPASSSISGNFFFKYKKNIKKIAFINKNLTSKIEIYVFDNSRQYIDGLISIYLHSFTKNDVNDRFVDVFAPSNNLKYKFGNLAAVAEHLFIVFEYED